MDEYKYEYYSDPNFWTNTNTNNIRVSICGRIRIRIIVIRIIFEYYSNTELFAHLCVDNGDGADNGDGDDDTDINGDQPGGIRGAGPQGQVVPNPRS